MATATDHEEVVDYEDYIDDQISRTSFHVKTVDLVSGFILLALAVVVPLFAVVIIDHWLVGLGFAGRLAALVGVVLAALFVLAARIVPPLFRSVNPEYSAQAVEQAFPSFKNGLVNFLFFRDRQDEVRESVYQGMQLQAANELAEVPIDSAVDRTQIIHLGYALVAITAIAVGYLLFSPKDPLQTLQRIAMPWSDIQRPSQVDIIEVAPGNVEIFRGQTVEVTARVGGLKEDQLPSIEYSTMDGQFVDQRVEMHLDGAEGHFAATLSSIAGSSLDGIQQDLEYRIVAGDATSRSFEILAIEAPHIVVERVEYDYPAYTMLNDEIVQGEGDIRAIEGTKVTVHGKSNQPIERSHIEFVPYEQTDSGRLKPPIQASMTGSGTAATVRFTLRMDEARKQSAYRGYRLHFQNEEGLASVDPIEYSMEATPDLKPVVQILQPDQRQIEIPENGWQQIEVRALDPDFQLTKVQLAARTRGRPLFRKSLYRAKLATEGHTGQFVGSFNFVPEDFELKNGDVVEYLAVAEDNRHSPMQNKLAANRTITARQYIRIVAPVENPGSPPDEAPENAQWPEEHNESNDDSSDPKTKSGGEQNQADPQSGEGGDAENQQPQGGAGGQEGEGGEQQDTTGEGGTSGTKSEGNQPSDSETDSSGESDSSASSDPQGDSGSEGSGGSAANEGNRDSENSSSENNEPGEESDSGDASNSDDRATGGDDTNSGGEADADEPLPSSGERDGDVVDRIRKHMEEQGELEQYEQQSANPESGSEQNPEQKNEPGAEQNAEPGAERGTEQDTRNQSSGDQPGEQGGATGETSGEPDGGEAPGETGDSAGGMNEENEASGKASSDEGEEGSTGQKDPGGEESGGEESGDTSSEESGGGGEQDSTGAGDKPKDGSQNEGAGSEAQDGKPSDQPGAAGSEGDRHTDAASTADEPGPSPPDGKPPTDQQPGGQDSQPDSGANAAESADAQNNDSSDSPPQGESGEQATDPSGEGNESSQDSAGESTDSNEGAKGESGESPGTESGNESSGESGESESGESDSSEGTEGKGDASESSKSSAESGVPATKQGTPSGSSSSGDTHGSGDGSFDQASSGDDANVEYAREATDLVLEYLRDKQGNPDQELLDKLGWKPEDVGRFLRRWDELKRGAQEGSPRGANGKRQLDDVLRGLGLQKPGNRVVRSQDNNDLQRNNRNTGRRSKVPAPLLDPFRAFQRALQRGN